MTISMTFSAQLSVTWGIFKTHDCVSLKSSPGPLLQHRGRREPGHAVLVHKHGETFDSSELSISTFAWEWPWALVRFSASHTTYDSFSFVQSQRNHGIKKGLFVHQESLKRKRNEKESYSSFPFVILHGFLRIESFKAFFQYVGSTLNSLFGNRQDPIFPCISLCLRDEVPNES